jgi:hypothetical protein
LRFNPDVYDLWVFRRSERGVEFLVLLISQLKADRYFNGGRFWQIPSGVFQDEGPATAAVDRTLAPYGLTARAVWAAEHTYTIYNQRFHELEVISVFAAEVAGDGGRCDESILRQDRPCSRLRWRVAKTCGFNSMWKFVIVTARPGAARAASGSFVIRPAAASDAPHLARCDWARWLFRRNGRRQPDSLL